MRSNGVDDNVYYKEGRKYRPFGLRYYDNYLPYGRWYVRQRAQSNGTANVDHYLQGLYKVGDPPEVIDIPRLCSIHSYVEYVMASPEFEELMHKGSYSFLELTAKIVALVVKLNQTLKDKEKEEKQNGTRQRHHSETF